MKGPKQWQVIVQVDPATVCKVLNELHRPKSGSTPKLPERPVVEKLFKHELQVLEALQLKFGQGQLDGVRLQGW